MKSCFSAQRGSTLAACWLGGLGLVLALVWLDGNRLASQREAAMQRTQMLVQRYQLTDLALFNEARYARHASQADRHAAFQDHPVAMEHFPAGSLMLPAR